MNKTSLNLVRLGGVLNLIMTAFHVFLCVVIYKQFGKEACYPLMQMFSVSGTLMIAFMAYTSLGQAREIVSTRLGCSVLALNIGIYVLRAAGEVVLFPRAKPLVIVLCLAIAAVYAIAMIKRQKSA